ncbi:uncharacterized protein MONOS_15328 [Monocercomonoides exilis]|uniref:uncharacterized protein n=1 Tax=Monocercomonoides exilis TaxID=2049356 RepID=UPI003559BDE7|nr:hypothetical protein MONOS_15328 [Monocercomonoides exilis]|eukprot:MONOS_15328.1-p1 / transcript=MONOS_15328.1 / gene=MONOS_15328 / organism=Monocercomonoides_exilis_PA203 / gene_product=unspecified product / transcript_product=unspecified product / location=Mono_scaffold01198:13368-14016(-) / protein_length=152 / sequence_SO=supercontig / SO=protein_coding / is_pseudo=false
MFDFIKNTSFLSKLLMLALAVMMFFSIINKFFVITNEDLALALIGCYAIHQGSSTLMLFFMAVAAFSTLFSVVHLIVIGITYKGVWGRIYFIVISSFLIVAKAVAAVLSFLCRNDFKDSYSAPSQGYSSGAPPPTTAYSTAPAGSTYSYSG